MDTVAGHRALKRRLHEPAVAIGNFDGVHLGHQRLFEEALGRARGRGAEAVVLTFEPHPAKVLNPSLAPPLITTTRRKLELIAEAGIDVCVVEPFDMTLAALAPTEFVDRVVVGALGAREVCVGHDFTFGRARGGNTTLLAELGRDPARGFAVSVLPPVTSGGMVCSSTKVREFVLEGKPDGAALILGRDPELEGEVVTGAGRGRTIGVPTANLRPDNELVPGPGVYAAWAEVLDGDGCRYDAAVNVGTNPTFTTGDAKAAVTIEAHLIDYPGDPLVGRRLRLGLRHRLRAEQRFPSVEALVEQIRRDIEAARTGASERPGER
jgi:riboflavin kinase/FMN adenylyltransferase